MRRLLLAILVASAGFSCSQLTDLSLEYVNRRPFDPPMELYAPWWNEVAKCVERSRSIAGIDWFLADQIGPTPCEYCPGNTTQGQWISNREITLLAGKERKMVVVKHEMMHDLLRGDGGHEHEGWRICDRRAGMPGDPGLPLGVYDFEFRKTELLKEWRFEGTLTITSATDDVIRGHWDVAAVASDSSSHYAEGTVSGAWDYDAYQLAAQIVGEPGWEVRHRIVQVDGEVTCLLAFAGSGAGVCSLDGPG